MIGVSYTKQMEIYMNNSLFRYRVTICMVFLLLFAQMFSLHIHFQHEESATSEHVVEVHVATFDDEHQVDYQDLHHSEEIKINAESVIKKMEFFSSFVLLFFLAIISLYLPKLLSIHQQFIKTKFTTHFYLLNPPLRAPPQ